MTLLAILADDLTGAADAGGAFASAGLVTALVFGDAWSEDVDVLVRSTNSRGLDAARAASVTWRVARSLKEAPPGRRPRWVYKKIDSVLRGHPCEELVAMMSGWGDARALVASALPAEGRTTVGGKQYADGVPVGELGWASPGRSADLLVRFGCNEGIGVHALDLATVRGGGDYIARAVRNTDAGIMVADAETDRDLAAIARGALAGGITVMAGSAGLARQLALAVGGTDGRRRPPVRHCASAPVLVAAASRHEATAAQVAALRDAGIPVVEPSQDVIDAMALPVKAVDEVVAHLAGGRSVVVSTAGLRPSKKGTGFVAELIGEVTAAVVSRSRVGGLVLTGGHVAEVVLARLGTRHIMLGGEVRPAIPWGTLHADRMHPVPVVTKAGSFGDRDVLLACLQYLEE